ncbi:hypothetical protein ACTPEM_22765, partial [Clostridioides difficile]
KKELFAFSEYLKLDINKRLSYNQILRKISRYIYYNRSSYAQKVIIEAKLTHTFLRKVFLSLIFILLAICLYIIEVEIYFTIFCL